MINVLLPLKRQYWKLLKRRDITLKERQEQRRLCSMREAQRQSLYKEFSEPWKVRRLIVFLTPGRDIVNGGVMSIVSLFNETREIEEIHGASCVICTFPDDPPLTRYTKFENTVSLFNFFDTLSYFSNISDILIHVPEYVIARFVHSLDLGTLKRLRELKVCINVLLQNIDLIDFEAVPALHELGSVTCTTAHRAYFGPETIRKMGCPVYLLSVFISPEKYKHTEYAKKQNLMVISPDEHPMREAIIARINRDLPELTTRVIKGISYSEYLNLIMTAKWALTFGEGLDGYFIETIFSGGIGITAYNDRFFTEDFRGLQTVYSSYDELAEILVSDINRLDNARDYSEYQRLEFNRCCEHYNHVNYVKNISIYYREGWPNPILSLQQDVARA